MADSSTDGSTPSLLGLDHDADIVDKLYDGYVNLQATHEKRDHIDRFENPDQAQAELGQLVADYVLSIYPHADRDFLTSIAMSNIKDALEDGATAREFAVRVVAVVSMVAVDHGSRSHRPSND